MDELRHDQLLMDKLLMDELRHDQLLMDKLLMDELRHDQLLMDESHHPRFIMLYCILKNVLKAKLEP